MSKIAWAIIAILVAMQLIFAMELMELSSLMKRIASIDEKTAVMKNEAALLELETERSRNNYYRILATSPFKLTEEEARGIIKRGVRNDQTGTQGD